MRLDKFLKVSRLVKQRPRAKILCDSGAVKLNGVEARAGKQVAVGNMIELTVGNRRITATILKIPEKNVSRSESVNLYEIKEELILNEQW